MEKRVAKRKKVEGITVRSVTALAPVCLIAKEALLVDASSTGFLLRLHRRDLVPKELRESLTLQSIEGEPIMLNLHEMDLDIDGYITRTEMIGKGVYELAVDFTQDAPAYWRECLCDLLPGEGEFEDV